MEQANKLFILSEVDDHIVGSLVGGESGFVKVIMRHCNNASHNRIQMVIQRKGKCFTIGYDAIYNGERIKQGMSQPFSPELLKSFVAQIANDAIPLS